MHQSSKENKLAENYYQMIPTYPDKSIIKQIVKQLTINSAQALMIKIARPRPVRATLIGGA